MTTALDVHVDVTEGAATFVLAGDIDRDAGDALDRAYSAAAGRGAASIRLDFTAVSYINSTGIALIVGLLGKARAAAVPVSACGLTDHYREIFEITRLSDFMTIDDAGVGGDAADPEGST
jgi:anti-sigma B factor antagonist